MNKFICKSYIVRLEHYFEKKINVSLILSL